MRWLNTLKNIVLPTAGFALGGPMGAAAGGALAGAIGYGRPKFKNVAKGAALGGAAGLGAAKVGLAGGQGFRALGSSVGGLKNMFAPGGGGLGRAAGAVGQFAKDNPELAAGAFQGAASAYGSNQQAAALERQIALQEQQEERAARAEEEERQRRIRVAQLLAPLFQQMQQQQYFS